MPSIVLSIGFPVSSSACTCLYFMHAVVYPCVKRSLLRVSTNSICCHSKLLRQLPLPFAGCLSFCGHACHAHISQEWVALWPVEHQISGRSWVPRPLWNPGYLCGQQTWQRWLLSVTAGDICSEPLRPSSLSLASL
jgi:hypothetical protein